jgi:hypothetical protein
LRASALVSAVHGCTPAYTTSPTIAVLIDGIQIYESLAASPCTPPWISSVCPSSVSVFAASGAGITGSVGMLPAYMPPPPHCFTLAFAVFLISATVAGSATSFALGKACLSAERPKGGPGASA